MPAVATARRHGGDIVFRRCCAGQHVRPINAVSGNYFRQAFAQFFTGMVGMPAVALAHLDHIFDHPGEICCQ